MADWQRIKDFDVEDGQDQLRFLLTCCMTNAQFQPDDITHVRDAYDADYGGDRDGFRIFELQDGKFGVLQDGEDYTGHG
jgi:hypothetical protein